MIRNITILFSILVLVALAIPASAQSSIADHVVINEIDINPPGNDFDSPREWIELYNPTDSDVDIGQWKIASTTVLKQTLSVPIGTVIGAGEFLTYSYKTVWFTDTNEIVELRDKSGIVVDATPLISDLNDDFSSWQRIYDGYDLDSTDDWKFEKSNAGSSNGVLPTAEDIQDVAVTIDSNKPTYSFGETAILKGHISERIFQVPVNQGDYVPESITVTIKGPDYNSEVLLYPALNLDFETTLSLHSVLGINEGEYEVLVSYAGATDSTSFFVGDEVLELEIPEDRIFAITTDKSQYLPGETVLISGITSEVIPFEGLKYDVKNSNGIIIDSGTLYPTNGEFSGSIFLTTVDTVYGTYVLTAEYLDKSSTSFELIEDVKEDVPISLWTDKEVYGKGDVVTITGRLNDLWVSSLDLEIIQTRNTAIGAKDYGGGGFTYKIKDVVRLEGDSSFKFTFQIPNNDNGLGDYRIKVSKAVGEAIKTMTVVENPSDYTVNREPLTISTDKSVYDFGDKITISGFVDSLSQSTTDVPVVNVSIKDKDGNSLTIVGGTGGGRLGTTGSVVSYDFTAVPDQSGRYSVTTELNRSIFGEGQYLVTSKYLKHINSMTFTVTDALATEGSASLFLDKEVYGLGETVHLSGLIPPTGDASLAITLTKPDGTIINSGTSVDNQQFSWEWVTPITETPTAIKSADDRSFSTTNLGTYKIQIKNPSYRVDVFFKVSLDPANDSLSILPIDVYTEKPIYQAGETLNVLGSVITKVEGNEGLVVPERVHLTITSEKSPTIKILEASVYPDQGGHFQSFFELPITIFSEGQYKVKAEYLNKRTDYSFGVANDFTYGLDEPLSLLVSSDKTQYHPGDIVIITGKPNKLVYLEEYNVSVLKKTGADITCGSFICGTHAGPLSTSRPSPNGSFTYQFTIPDSVSFVGRYEITVEADFEIKKLMIDVVEPSAVETLPQTFIEKVNNISDVSVSANVVKKDFEGVPAGPRVLLGSLITSPRGEEPNVNLRVVTATGVCIIGQADDCHVKDSTRKPGEIYDILYLPFGVFRNIGDDINIDPLHGIILKVRYSGPDARVEKFSILPESPTELLPDTILNIQVVKNDQVSKLYYKINYSPLE
jgi:hypothetical protein